MSLSAFRRARASACSRSGAIARRYAPGAKSASSAARTRLPPRSFRDAALPASGAVAADSIRYSAHAARSAYPA